MNKVITSIEAAKLIKDGDTIAIAGFGGGTAYPEDISLNIEKVYKESGHPQNLTLVFASGTGDSGKSDSGLNHFAYPQMVKRVVAGHVGLSTKLSSLINQNKIEAYNFPQGVVTHLYRAIGGKKPGVLTHVGLETFADPRVEGCKMNEVTKEDLVNLVNVEEKNYLLYKSFPIQVGLIRATTADEFGNLTMEKEAVFTETLQIATAVKNCGGIVIAQVERIAKHGALNAKDVKVPGVMVDYVVEAEKQNHRMNFVIDYNPSYSCEVNTPSGSIDIMSMSERKIIAKRCALELTPNTVVNLGIGVPDGVASIALEEGISDQIYMTIESGVMGGIPAPGLNIGAASNPEAMLTHPQIFDYYDGGGIDVAFLGLAQLDKNGNINVSKFNGRMVGCGGFVNITQNSKKVVFCGTFTAGKAQYEIKNNKLNIVRDGEFKKLIDKVEQITFSGKYALDTNQTVLYVTERAVFKLTDKGLVLTEIAPGVDLQKHILDKMDFTPIIDDDLKVMDSKIFIDEPMGIKQFFIK